MDNIKINIEGFDEVTQSLLLTFESGKIKTPVRSFHPGLLKGSTIEEKLKTAALSGVAELIREKGKEEFTSNSELIAGLSSKVGSSVTYTKEEMIAYNASFNANSEVLI
jgi:hypothetical protein